MNAAVEQLDKAAQHGASSSEELAATAEEMAAQVQELRNTIGFFKLSEDDTSKQSVSSSNNGDVLPVNVTSMQAKPIAASEVNEKDFENFA